MMSLSGSADGLGDAIGPSVVCAQFGFILPLPTATVVVGLVAAVSVSAWDTWTVSACAGKEVHLAPLVRMLGDNASESG